MAYPRSDPPSAVKTAALDDHGGRMPIMMSVEVETRLVVRHRDFHGDRAPGTLPVV